MWLAGEILHVAVLTNVSLCTPGVHETTSLILALHCLLCLINVRPEHACMFRGG